MATALPPLAGQNWWLPCMEAAGYQCQCTGQCAKLHRNGPCGERHRPAVHLVAVSFEDNWTAAASDHNLTAMCPPCYSGWAKKRRAATLAQIPQADGLF